MPPTQVQAGLFDGLFGGGNSQADMEKEEAYRCVATNPRGWMRAMRLIHLLLCVA